jgi:hypothetical protein
MFRTPQVILFSEDLERAVTLWSADSDGNPIPIVQPL